MQPRASHSPATRLASQRVPSDRVSPFIALGDYSAGGLIHETRHPFDAGLRFGRGRQTDAVTCPAGWLEARVRNAIEAAELSPIKVLPIQVSAPAPLLYHRETARSCHSMLCGRDALRPEICLVFDDAALATSTANAVEALNSLRTRGFRIGLNARRSWLSLRCQALLPLIETIWVNAAQLEIEDEIAQRTRSALAAGTSCIGFGGTWSQTEEYSRAGITHLFRPRTDA